jgi:hypothetical protein
MRNLLIEEFTKLEELADELGVEFSNLPSVFKPHNIETFFPQLLKNRLSIEEIRILAKTIVGHIIEVYNKRIVEYIQKKYNFEFNNKTVSDYFRSNSDYYKNDGVLNWIDNKGLKHLNNCMNYLCVDTEQKLIDLIKLTDLQLGFSTGDDIEDMERWLFEIPLSFYRRLEKRDLLKKDKLTIVEYLDRQITKKSYPSSYYQYINANINYRGEEIKFIIEKFDFVPNKRGEYTYEFTRPADLSYSIDQS